jgi:hypothetical protein
MVPNDFQWIPNFDQASSECSCLVLIEIKVSIEVEELKSLVDGAGSGLQRAMPLP